MARQNGFTLLELIVTLAVAMILVSVAVPNLQTITMNSRQSGAVNELVSAMRLARSTAVSRNDRVSVCVSGDGASCTASGWETGFIVFTDPDSDRVVDADETVLTSGGPVESVRITPSVVGSALTYRPNGRLTNAAVGGIVGQLTVCDERGSSHAKAISIDLSGRPRLITAEHGGLTC